MNKVLNKYLLTDVEIEMNSRLSRGTLYFDEELKTYYLAHITKEDKELRKYINIDKIEFLTVIQDRE